MSTPEQPATPPLTRRQLRELRNTGTTPIVPADAISPDVSAESPEPPAESPIVVPPPAPHPRPAQPVAVPEPPAPDASVDLGVSPLTRRQARQQERIRTASVPVITPDIIAAHTAGAAAADAVPAVAVAVADVDTAEDTEEARAIVDPDLGAALLGAEIEPDAFVASFDDLLTQSTSGSVATPSALIVSQNTGDSAIVAPIAATGEVIVTGSFNLPEGLGSLGHVPGVADGKEVDAVLVDGELPAHSSPTPISASAAISTVKGPGEIITPPAPEKNNKLMVTLAITAGVLAAALVGVLAVAIITGIF